jgi:hypothetical protein
MAVDPELLVEISEARAAGITEAMADDETLRELLLEAGEYLERETELSFRATTHAALSPLLLDGTGHDTLWLQTPIITVTALGERTVSSAGVVSYSPFLASSYEIFRGRSPGSDDRSNPKIVRTSGIFPEGVRSIYLVGQTGWTDQAPDPTDEDDPPLIERAPRDIRRAVLLLVVNDLLPSIVDSAAQSERLRRYIVSENTEGHSYSLGEVAMSGGPTGLREVDRIVSRYKARRPRYVGR